MLEGVRRKVRCVCLMNSEAGNPDMFDACDGHPETSYFFPMPCMEPLAVSQEHEKVLAFYPTSAELPIRSAIVGLAQAFSTFSTSFAPPSEVGLQVSNITSCHSAPSLIITSPHFPLSMQDAQIQWEA